MGCSSHDNSFNKPTDKAIKELPDLDRTKIKQKDENEENLLIINKSSINPAPVINEIKTIIPHDNSNNQKGNDNMASDLNTNLINLPQKDPVFTFGCEFSREKLTEEVNKFIKESKEQDIFYNNKSEDEIYNKLRQKELSFLREKFTSSKEKYLADIKNKFKEEFDKYNIDFENLSNKIMKLENGDFVFTNKIREAVIKIEEIQNDFSVKHITVLLVGKSGVGKSTLCNNLLRLKEGRKALTAIGKPVTMKSMLYNDKSVNYLKIIDTAGIEIHGENKIENVIKTCKETIDTQVKSKDKNDMVSCIFYCFTGTRIEEEEIEFLDQLRNSLKGNSIPILYIYTQAVRQSAIDEMKKCIQKETKRLGEVEFVPVLAEDYDLIDNKYLKAYGLDNILEKAVATIKNNIKSNLFEVRTKEISDDIIQKLTQKNDKIRKFSREKMYLYFTTNLLQTFDKEKLVDFIFLLFEKCFIFYLEPGEIKKLNKNSRNEYDKTFKNYIEKCYDLFDKSASDIINEFIYKQAGIFLNEQAKIEKLGRSILNENVREIDDFVKIIDDYCRKNFLYIAEKIFVRHFINEILEKICKKNEEICNNFIKRLISEEKSIKDAINKCFITKYRNIENSIKEYKLGMQANIYGRNYV